MRQTKTREPLFRQIDDVPDGNLPELVRLTPEEYAEALARDEQRRREWAAINQALRDNLEGGQAGDVAMALGRRRAREPYRTCDDAVRGRLVPAQPARREGVIDQDLSVLLLHFRRGLTEEYGRGPAALMLIDRAVAAYQDFIRVTGWVGNLAILIEHEFFGVDGPSAHFKDRYRREGRTIRGLTVEQHLARLREGSIPLAERCGRIMRKALPALEALRSASSAAVERSKPIKISVQFDRSGVGPMGSSEICEPSANETTALKRSGRN